MESPASFMPLVDSTLGLYWGCRHVLSTIGDSVDVGTVALVKGVGEMAIPGPTGIGMSDGGQPWENSHSVSRRGM